MSNDAPYVPCRNCGTVLQGPFCHICGQHGHDPLRSFAHAVEDVFESFWHLDGRVFRTLRELLVPGRVASAYLDGRRARYLPPLRLFVILTVLTFFVGKLTLHADPQADAGGDAAGTAVETDLGGIPTSNSVDDVLRERALLIHQLRVGAQDDPTAAWFASGIEELVRPRIDEAARERMRTLGASAAEMDRLDAQIRTDNQAAAERSPDGWMEEWLARRAMRIRENAALIQREPDAFVRLFLGAVPGALFALVPLFALCLKLLYLGSGRGYLQHLAVALYSHSLMLLALLATFVVAGVQTAFVAPVADAMTAASALLLGIGVPLYLLLMQKRVYRERWPWTLLKYATLGVVYVILLCVAGMYAVFAGLSA